MGRLQRSIAAAGLAAVLASGAFLVVRWLPIEFQPAETGELARGKSSPPTLSRRLAKGSFEDSSEPREVARRPLAFGDADAQDDLWPVSSPLFADTGSRGGGRTTADVFDSGFDAAAGLLGKRFAPGTADPELRSRVATSKREGQRFQWQGTDLEGRPWHIDWAPANGVPGALAVVFLSIDCPIANASIPELNRLHEEFAGRGGSIYGVISSRGTTRAAARRHFVEFDAVFPVLFDAAGELRERLGATHVPQAILFDRHGRLAYSGRIDDRYASVGRKRPTVERRYLQAALEAALEGRPVPVPQTEPVGCLMEDLPLEDAAAVVTWCRHIAPLVWSRCAGCHRAGEVAPFPLLSYEDVAGRARQIVAVTHSRLMPPWRPEPQFGRFRDERRLSEAELALLEGWAAAGAQRGNPEDLPTPPEFISGWRLGKPDLVLELPQEFTVPAEGNDIYQYFVLPTGLTDDRMVRAIAFRPTNPRGVHPASLCYDTSGAARRLDDEEPGPGYARFGGAGFAPGGTLGGWAPGVTPRFLPDGLGRPLPAGSDVVVQIHYRPVGRPERDRSRIGLHFAKSPVRQELSEILVANMDLRIPAGAQRHGHHASYVLPVGVTLHAVAPHMHLLGREVKAVAFLPDGRVQPLVWIRDWDFNWQDQYFYEQPLELPPGTRIDVLAVYDNSAANPANPNAPPQDVRWGERSVDEMGICYLDVTCATPEERARLAAHNQAEFARQLREHPWLLERR
ncbi:MAG: redoxin domain-containing protein [Planctomycetes bacterium]|nr:redoxin domain-containing protein [Planctomycetota bacterium]